MSVSSRTGRGRCRSRAIFAMLSTGHVATDAINGKSWPVDALESVLGASCRQCIWAVMVDTFGFPCQVTYTRSAAKCKLPLPPENAQSQDRTVDWPGSNHVCCSARGQAFSAASHTIGRYLAGIGCLWCETWAGRARTAKAPKAPCGVF